MKYVEALNAADKKEQNEKWLFLAGGITGTPDWQADMCDRLKDVPNLVVFNPRRANFPIHDPQAAEQQIAWEWGHLKAADAISFWFPANQIQPIALFELGRWSTPSKPVLKPFADNSLKLEVVPKPIFVGVDADYPRRQDVEIQLGLERPGLKIVYSLADLAAKIKEWMKG